MVHISIFQAIVYGIVQGLGEFLPISSTAHLILVPWLFGWEDPKLAFDVALHLGTLVAVVGFFWKDWLRLIGAGLTKGTGTPDGRLFWFIVVATIPGALFGKLFEEKVETVLRDPALIGVMLIIMGVVLYIADRYGRKQIQLEKVGLGRSILIGLSQAFALIPGVSRSGITISAGLFSGLTREGAAKFSFFLSAPIIFGSVVLKVKDIIHPQAGFISLAVAVITSAAVGVLSIKFLLDYLKNKGFGIFVWYRFVLGIIVIAVYLIRL
jgi:undecaprenyl-diphosphatase